MAAIFRSVAGFATLLAAPWGGFSLSWLFGAKVGPRALWRPVLSAPFIRISGNAMPALETKLNARSADFQANAAAMQAQVDDLNAQSRQGRPGRR
jgi:hypothetical protein